MDSKFNLDEIQATAAHFLIQIKGNTIIALHGEMGAGKTTFVHAICKELGITDMVSSPTFSIINQYYTPQGKTIYHMDLYRLKDEEEAIMAGVEDCFYSGNLCFVEWPENAPGIFPENTLHCYLTSSGKNERKLQIK